MSAHTKPCDRCKGRGHTLPMWNARTECAYCKGTCRVPDVEATLRVELDAARAEVARLTAAAERLLSERGRVSAGAADAYRSLNEAQAEVARLTALWREHDQRQAANTRIVLDSYEQVVAESNRLTAEVERLTAELADERKDRAEAQYGFDHAIADRDRMIVRNRELEGEVERLTADLATVRADHRTATGTLLAVAAAYNGWAIRGVGQHRAEYALEQIGKALGKPF